MGIFGRLVAGAGQGASEIASKYVDESLAEQRAQALADIANASAQKMDAYTNSDERRSRLRDLSTQDTVAAGGAADQVKLNTAGNDALTQAGIAQSNAITAGTADADAAKVGIMTKAKEDATPIKTNPGEIVYNPDGSVKVRNDNLTAAQAQLQALREGLKGQKGEQRDRAYEAQANILRDAIKEKSAAIDKLLEQNPDALTPPKPAETNMIFPNKPAEVKPAYDNYQRLLADRATLTRQAKDVIDQWHSESGKAGVRGPSAGATRDLGVLSGDAGTADTSGSGNPTSKYASTAAEKDIPGSLRREAAAISARMDAAGSDPEKLDRARRDMEELQQEATRQKVDLNAPAPADAIGAGRGAVVPPVGAPGPTNTPAPKPGSIAANAVATSYPSLSPKEQETARYIQDKLVGSLDGPDALLKIAQTNENPDFRVVALKMYRDFKRRASDNATQVADPLGLGL